MIDITRFAELVPRDHGLAVIALALPDGTAHASVASAGVLSHPITGVPVVGIVVGGGSAPPSSGASPRHRRPAGRLAMDGGGGHGRAGRPG